ncbi:hypothetical protein [Gemmatimonas sp.]
MRSHKNVAPKLLYLYLAPTFQRNAEQCVKARTTAAALGLKPRTVRRALLDLVAFGLLDVVTPPTIGAPGVYRLGRESYTQVPIFEASQRDRARSRARQKASAVQPEATPTIPDA